MEDNPLEPYLSIIGLLTTFISQYCAELIIADMSSDSTGSFRWSPDEQAIERWWSAQGLACRKEGVGDL